MELTVVQGDRNLGYYVNVPYHIGDIVRIINHRSVFPTFIRGFKFAWGTDSDSFHNNCNGHQYRDYYGAYGNYWMVIGFFVHPCTKFSIVLALRNRNNENLLIECDAVDLIRRVNNKVGQPSYINKLD